jgi:hypothetical protein
MDYKIVTIRTEHSKTDTERLIHKESIDEADNAETLLKEYGIAFAGQPNLGGSAHGCQALPFKGLG